jgi:hypothetical protein
LFAAPEFLSFHRLSYPSQNALPHNFLFIATFSLLSCLTDVSIARPIRLVVHIHRAPDQIGIGITFLSTTTMDAVARAVASPDIIELLADQLIEEPCRWSSSEILHCCLVARRWFRPFVRRLWSIWGRLPQLTEIVTDEESPLESLRIFEYYSPLIQTFDTDHFPEVGGWGNHVRRIKTVLSSVSDTEKVMLPAVSSIVWDEYEWDLEDLARKNMIDYQNIKSLCVSISDIEEIERFIPFLIKSATRLENLIFKWNLMADFWEQRESSDSFIQLIGAFPLLRELRIPACLFNQRTIEAASRLPHLLSFVWSDVSQEWLIPANSMRKALSDTCYYGDDSLDLQEPRCPMSVLLDHVVDGHAACFTSLTRVRMDGRLRGHTTRRLSPSFCNRLVRLDVRLDCDDATEQDLHLVTSQLSQICSLQFLSLNLCNGFGFIPKVAPLDDQALGNLGKLKLLEELTILSPELFGFSGDSLIRSSEAWSRMIQLILADGNFGSNKDQISHSVPIAVLPRLLSNMSRLKGIVFRVSEDASDFPPVLRRHVSGSVYHRRVFLDLMGSFCRINPTTSHPPATLFNFLFEELPVDIALYADKRDLEPANGISDEGRSVFWQEFWRSPRTFTGFNDSGDVGNDFCYRTVIRKPVETTD